MRFALCMALSILAIVATVGLIGNAATTRTPIYTTPQALYQFDAVTVDSNGWTDVSDEIPVFNVGRMIGLRVENTGNTNALDGFQILAKIHPEDGAYFTWLAGTDFDTATSIVRSVSTAGPHEIDSNGVAWVLIDTTSVWSVKLQASADTNPTTVQVNMNVGAGAK